MIGKTLGHYQITNQLGKGGMGEVYQAKDQKLGRDVAIKVLPEEFAKDTERIARFQREAKLLASLNHPNIAAIHGLEESGGTNFLVLELVEGETLADQIKSGPIPVEDSLKLALQIAEALEAAHEKSVIHRDLKPANIKVTPEGKVKVLDFGLAKAFAGEQENLNLSNSPTLSNAATQQGVILGTAAYMSPEQARGKSVDKRADIWAFGCVLYEMLTGQAAFQGEDITEILASVVKGGANLDLLPVSIHPRVREVLTRCLQKDLKRRYQDIGDVRYDIEQVLAEPPGSLAQPIPAGPHGKLRTIAPWLAAVVIICIITGLAVWRLKPAEPRQIVRFYHDLPEDQQVSKAPLSVLAVSADGNQFVYCTPKGIYVRSLNESSAKLIPGTEGDPEQPFFSPDGKWIGYFSASDQQLKKIAINGGTPVTLGDVRNLYGASWDESNTIVFSQLSGDIMSIPANSGRAETILKGKLPVFPQVLPGRKSVLYTEPTSGTQGKIVVQPIKSGKPKELFAAYGARYLSTGHIVYRTGNTLFAVPFDLKRMETTGGPVPVVEGLREAVISDSGTLVYIPGNALAATPGLNLVWVNREGKEQPLSAPVNSYGFPSNSAPRISPDGTRVALTFSIGANENIWIWDFAHESMTRLTFDEGEDGWPLWSPDSKRIVYRSRDHEINRRAADGSGEVEKLGSLPDSGLDIPGPFSWSRDGKTLLSWDLILSPLHTDIGSISLEGGLSRKPLLQEKYNKDHPQVSPDGRWLAYASNESGHNEVYVRSFPEVNKGRWQISMDGGNGPLWSPNGRELFYRNGDSVMAVSVETEPTFKPGKPKMLFRGTYFSDNIGQAVLPRWDISPDGKRFLMMKESGQTSTGGAPRKINIVLNWLEELKARVPTK
jgi:Tol biopolymer transport system component